MAIITTYVCDVSGKQGQAAEFVKVTISAREVSSTRAHYTAKNLEKVVHRDVAIKLNLLDMKHEVEPAQPEPTFESKLGALLKDYVEEIAYEAGQEAASNYSRNS